MVYCNLMALLCGLTKYPPQTHDHLVHIRKKQQLPGLRGVCLGGLFLCLVFCPDSFNLYLDSLLQHFHFSTVTFWNVFSTNQQTHKQDRAEVCSTFALVPRDGQPDRQTGQVRVTIKKNSCNSNSRKKNKLLETNKKQKCLNLRWARSTEGREEEKDTRIKDVNMVNEANVSKWHCPLYLFLSVSTGFPREQEARLQARHDRQIPERHTNTHRHLNMK